VPAVAGMAVPPRGGCGVFNSAAATGASGRRSVAVDSASEQRQRAGAGRGTCSKPPSSRLMAITAALEAARVTAHHPNAVATTHTGPVAVC